MPTGTWIVIALLTPFWWGLGLLILAWLGDVWPPLRPRVSRLPARRPEGRRLQHWRRTYCGLRPRIPTGSARPTRWRDIALPRSRFASIRAAASAYGTII